MFHVSGPSCAPVATLFPSAPSVFCTYNPPRWIMTELGGMKRSLAYFLMVNLPGLILCNPRAIITPPEMPCRQTRDGETLTRQVSKEPGQQQMMRCDVQTALCTGRFCLVHRRDCGTYLPQPCYPSGCFSMV